MQEEEFVIFVMMLLGSGALGYWLGRLRASKEYLERFGDLLRMQKSKPRDDDELRSVELERVRAAIEGMGHRFDLMEQRVDFTERLMDTAQRKAVPRADEEWTNRR